MKVEVYSKDGCPNCVNVKKLLDKKEIPYTITDLTNDTERMKFFERVGNGVRTMPQIFIDDERVGGFNETVVDPRIRGYQK